MEVRMDWLQWKKLLMERLKNSLGNHLQTINQDVKIIAPLLTRFQNLVFESRSYLDDLLTNIELVKQEYLKLTIGILRSWNLFILRNCSWNLEK
jgi:hypothetical protein